MGRIDSLPSDTCGCGSAEVASGLVSVDDAHASDAEAVQGLPVALEVGQRVLLEHAVRLQEPVQLGL